MVQWIYAKQTFTLEKGVDGDQGTFFLAVSVFLSYLTSTRLAKKSDVIMYKGKR